MQPQTDRPASDSLTAPPATPTTPSAESPYLAARYRAKQLAAASLFRNRQRLQALLAHTQDLVLTLDPEGVCCEASPSCAARLGFAPEAIVGRSLDKLFHGDDLRSLREAMQRALTTPQAAQTSLAARLYANNGNWRVFEVTAAAVMVDGRLTETMLICHDVTDRQRTQTLVETLERTEAQYRSIFESVGEGIYRVAPDGRYISANPKLAEIFGYPSPEALVADSQQTKSQHYLNPRRWLEFICGMDDHGRLDKFESRAKRRDGQVVWIAENARAVFDRWGNLICYEGTVSDITQRKQAEEALQRANEGLEQRVRERTAALLESNDKLRFEITQRERAQAALKLGNQALSACSNGIIISDARLPEAPIVFVNPAFERMTGYAIDEAVGETYKLLAGPDTDPEDLAALWQAVIEQREYRTVLKTYRQDGTAFWSELSVSPIYDEEGQVVHLVGIQNDVTERRQLAEDLQKALESERELNELKSRFISTASHEFRTPLTVILAAAEYLERYHETAPLEKRQKQLDRIRKAGRNMTQLLEDVLHISKAEANRLEFSPQPIALVPFCQDLLEELRACDPASRPIALHINRRFRPAPLESLGNIASQGLRQRVGDPTPPELRQDEIRAIVYSKQEAQPLDAALEPAAANSWDLAEQLQDDRHFLDPKLLRHILSNLIANAIKYSPDGSPIDVTLNSSEQAITIAVRDRGIGIPAADLPHLFESFHRANNVGTIQGTGLGLAIVKNAVDLHGGTIRVTSQEGKGTEFTVSLPRKRMAPTASPSP